MMASKNPFILSQAAQLFGAGNKELAYYSGKVFEHRVVDRIMTTLGYDKQARLEVQARSDSEGGDFDLLSWDSFVELYSPLPFSLSITTLPKKSKEVNFSSILFDFAKTKLYKLWRTRYNEGYDFTVVDASGFAASGGLVVGCFPEKEVVRRRSCTVMLSAVALADKRAGFVNIDHVVIGALVPVLEYLLDAEIVFPFVRPVTE
jgi:hypothetical protein